MSEISSANILPSRLRSSVKTTTAPTVPTVPVAKKNNRLVKLAGFVAELEDWNQFAKVYLEMFFVGSSLGEREVCRLENQDRKFLKKRLFTFLRTAESMAPIVTKVNESEDYSLVARRFTGLQMLLSLEYRNVHKQFNSWKRVSSCKLPDEVTTLLSLFRINNELLIKYLAGTPFSKSDWKDGRKICMMFKKFIIEANANNVVHLNTVTLVYHAVKEFKTLYKAWKQE